MQSGVRFRAGRARSRDLDSAWQRARSVLNPLPRPSAHNPEVAAGAPAAHAAVIEHPYEVHQRIY